MTDPTLGLGMALSNIHHYVYHKVNLNNTQSITMTYYYNCSLRLLYVLESIYNKMIKNCVKDILLYIKIR